LSVWRTGTFLAPTSRAGGFTASSEESFRLGNPDAGGGASAVSHVADFRSWFGCRCQNTDGDFGRFAGQGF
jgi:hypothetical protein